MLFWLYLYMFTFKPQGVPSVIKPQTMHPLQSTILLRATSRECFTIVKLISAPGQPFAIPWAENILSVMGSVYQAFDPIRPSPATKL